MALQSSSTHPPVPHHHGRSAAPSALDIQSPRAGSALAAAYERASSLVRPAGIEPAACGLKDRCSLAPRREPLTTELRARAVVIYSTRRSVEHLILSTPEPHRRARGGLRAPCLSGRQDYLERLAPVVHGVGLGR